MQCHCPSFNGPRTQLNDLKNVSYVDIANRDWMSLKSKAFITPLKNITDNDIEMRCNWNQMIPNKRNPEKKKRNWKHARDKTPITFASYPHPPHLQYPAPLRVSGPRSIPSPVAWFPVNSLPPGSSSRGAFVPRRSIWPGLLCRLVLHPLDLLRVRQRCETWCPWSWMQGRMVPWRCRRVLGLWCAQRL